MNELSLIEKRPIIRSELHSKAALDAALLSDDIVPDRTDSLLVQYPFLASRLPSEADRLAYDNAPYYENARWLILTMAELINEIPL